MCASSKWLLFTALVCGAMTSACAARETTSRAAVAETRITSATAPARTATPAGASVAVSDDIERACALQFLEVERAPKFRAGRSDLLEGDHEVLDAIAACITTGPLAGRSIRLVGHTDSRGTVDDNMTLGARRARAVGTYLETVGVPKDRIHEMSRGELDATGDDETSRRLDRRVDVILLP